MISHCNVTTQCDRALQNAANSVPASAHTEVERATCTSPFGVGKVRSPGPSFPGKCGSRVLAWQGGEDCLGALCGSQLEVRRVKWGPAG